MVTEQLRPPLPDGIVAVVKRDCPTCELVAPVLTALDGQLKLTVFSQDDPGFPEGMHALDDTSKAASKSSARSAGTAEIGSSSPA
jgi:hypothetical protein